MDNILNGGDFFMKSPLFKDNIEDREIRFKSPEEIDVINNKSKTNSIRQVKNLGKEVK